MGNPPGLLEALGRAAGLPVETESHAWGGMSLEGQWASPRGREFLRVGGWDAVVLQDHRLGPVRAPLLTRAAARVLCAEVARSGARPVPYATWARRGRPEQQAAWMPPSGAARRSSARSSRRWATRVSSGCREGAPRCT